ncbi:ImmA/IrrE family metallo-endopeptidase [Methylophilus sp. 13]|uniref:ImmA/IrrE family metallo-endopeptidase n=1 Tax=Methylophilus sp. 13 TaxID=2781018 RepID=UPI00188FDF8C|nr:ImmA/IrrE family metallo-endopeptidase [Methylophilus sp. 13]MBF5039898.1 ImmA/IrrE family metallo-endopeptidase [Methylophilus sp. 13]
MIIASSKAERRLLELGIHSPNEIDLEAIAWDEGVRVQYKELIGCEARLVGYNNRAIVTIRNQSDQRRKRFSLAHELGHWNYHRGRSFECRVDDWIEGYTVKPAEEREADTYASELLMPKYMFEPVAKKLKRPTFDGVKQLADAFNTSITATAIRLVNINAWPLVLVCHSKNGRVWFNRSKDVPERWFPQKELSQDSMAFDQLFANEARVRAQKATADTWFDNHEAERYEIIEDAIKISNDRVLSLLWIENDEMLKEISYSRFYR